MKTLYHKLIVLIFIVFLLPSLGGIAGGLYAQQQELFDNTWYLEKVNVSGVEYVLANYYTDEPAITEFDELDSSLYISLCEFVCLWAEYVFDSTNNLMSLSDIDECVIAGECTASSTDLYYYKDIYFSIFYEWDSSTQTWDIFNPFTYTLQAIDDYHKLIIENNKGDWALYNSKLLSNPHFNQTGFALYPNPVIETLHIKNTFNQTVQASIYDVNGKLLHNQTIDNNNATIDVKSLNQGMYFVVFESEIGERVSRTLIKK